MGEVPRWQIEIKIAAEGHVQLSAVLSGVLTRAYWAAARRAEDVLEVLHDWFDSCREAVFEVLILNEVDVPERLRTFSPYLALYFVAMILERRLAPWVEQELEERAGRAHGKEESTGVRSAFPWAAIRRAPRRSLAER
jgi:hypothetical protein